MPFENDNMTSVIEKVCAYFRQSSLNVMQLQSRIPNIELGNLDTDRLVYGHWAALILVTSDLFRFTFKTHFMTDDARYFASGGGTSSRMELKRLAEQDFMKEYCNVAAGLMKRGFEQQGVSCGISIPLVSKGYIELFFRPLQSSGKDFRIFEDGWTLKTKEAAVNCNMLFEIREPQAFAALPCEFSSPDTSNDEVFLEQQ